MTSSTSDWLLINYEAGTRLSESICQLHHAVQFIAIAGKYLVDEKPDDSHTNFIWDMERMAFIGKFISGPVPFRFALQARNMNLVILDKNENEISSLHLPGVTRGYTFAWMKEQVADLGVNHTLLKIKMHYSIPRHAIDKCGSFRISDPVSFRELAYQRTNAERVLNEVSGQFPGATLPAVWPHHFDTGIVIPVETNTNKEIIKSIGAGYAIPDIYSADPYFYVSLWTKEAISYGNSPKVKYGYWNEKDWQGAILQISHLNNIKDLTEQKQTVFSFFEEAIDIGIKLLKADNH